MPLGLMPGMGYEEKEAVLETGEAALFYSDGLIEAHDPKGEMFGVPRLRRLVAERAAEEGSLVDFLMEELSSFVGEGWEQEDDITLVTLRRSTSENGTSSTTSLTTGDRQKRPSSSDSWKAKASIWARFCRFSIRTVVISGFILY
jgi:Stage II sporulation protein E (SpoIIE)